MLNAYQILGVEEGASLEEIKRRFRVLCLDLHPDRSPLGSAEFFRSIREAYRLLTNADLKKSAAYQASFKKLPVVFSNTSERTGLLLRNLNEIKQEGQVPGARQV